MELDSTAISIRREEACRLIALARGMLHRCGDTLAVTHLDMALAAVDENVSPDTNVGQVETPA